MHHATANTAQNYVMGFITETTYITSYNPSTKPTHSHTEIVSCSCAYSAHTFTHLITITRNCCIFTSYKSVKETLDCNFTLAYSIGPNRKVTSYLTCRIATAELSD